MNKRHISKKNRELIIEYYNYLRKKSRKFDHYHIFNFFSKNKHVITYAILTPISIAWLYITSVFLLKVISGLTSQVTSADAEAAQRWSIIALAALVSAPVYLWRSWIMHKQTRILSDQLELSEKRQINEQYTRAIDQLGASREIHLGDIKNNQEIEPGRKQTIKIIEQRIGAIYALEKISEESIGYYFTVLEVLCTYLHSDSAIFINQYYKSLSMENLAELGPHGQGFDSRIEIISHFIDLDDSPGPFRTPDADILAALSVIRRRKDKANLLAFAGMRIGDALNLDEVCIDYAPLQEANLDYASLNRTILPNAQMEFVNLRFAKLKNAYLRGTSFNMGNLHNADFSNSDLSNTDLRGANLSRANLKGANLLNAMLYGTNLFAADLRDVRGLEESQLQSTKLDSETKLPDVLQHLVESK